MNTQHSLSNQQIIDGMSKGYGITVTTLTPISLGADIYAGAYKAQADNQLSYFVKLKRNHQEIAPLIQQLLHDANIALIVAPVKAKSSQITQRIADSTLIVYPFIEANDGFTQALTDNQWIQLGKAVKQIHTLPVPTEIKNQIKQEAYSSEWRDTVRSIYMHIDKKPAITDPIALKFIAVMKEHRDVIEQMIYRTEQLAHTIKQQSPELVLCHADLHGGNVLLTDDGALYIVDWDQPIMAPKERDLMFIGSGVGNIWNNPHEEEFFYQGYGATKINKEILAYYRYERIIEDIAEYGQQLLLTTDGNDRDLMYKHFVDMFKPRGVMDIALKTDIGVKSSELS